MNPSIEKVLRLPGYQKALLTAAMIAVIVGLFVYLLFLPQLKNFEALQAKNDSLQTKLQEDRRVAANLGKYRAEYERMQEQLQQALTELPNEKEIPALLSSIASLAKDNGLDVLRFKPGGEASRGFYAEVPVELKLVGSYHEVALFFQAVGNLPRIVNVGNLSMGSAKPMDGRTVLSVDCLATTFRFIENPAPAAPVKGKKK